MSAVFSIKHLSVILVVSAVVVGFAYMASQQVLRQEANNPQTQIVEDTADAPSTKKAIPGRDQTGTKMDIAKSISTFIII